MLQLINHVPLAGLMLVVALGYQLGRPEWRGLTLTPSGGTLVVGLLLGWLGLDMSALYGAAPGALPRMTVGGFGFALFIYAVGYEAGPRFSATLRQGALRFLALALLLNLTALGLACLGAWLFRLGDAEAAGALAGALTSTPALVAASQVVSEPGRLTISYALTYPLGQVGLILLVGILPRLFGDSLEAEAAPAGGDGEAPEEGRLKRAYRVGPAAGGQSLRQLCLRERTGCVLTRVHRGADVFVPDAETVLQAGDHVYASGHLDDLQRLTELLGPEVYDAELRDRLPPPRRITVTSQQAAGRSLAQLELIGRHHCLVLRVQRDEQWLDPSGPLVLQRDDVLEVVGQQRAVNAVAELVGRLDPAPHETHVAAYALGVLGGVVLGSLSVRVGGVDISLGAAGGLLLAGIAVGHFRRIGPFPAMVPRAARQWARDLGLLLFMAESGVRGGPRLLEGLRGPVLGTVATSLVTLLGAFLLSAFLARRVLRLAPLDAWGGLCGAMTSTTALEAVNRAAGHSGATVGYAACYAAATLLVTVSGQAVALAVRAFG